MSTYRRLALLHTPSLPDVKVALTQLCIACESAWTYEDTPGALCVNMPNLQQVPHNYLTGLKCLIDSSHLS